MSNANAAPSYVYVPGGAHEAKEGVPSLDSQMTGGSKVTRLSAEPPKSKEVSAVLEGIKRLYKHKILPLEKQFCFDEFMSPSITDTDFDAQPMVLLLGQYSTGKTTFIQYLVEKEFPGSRIGPEPTTDRFVAIMHGPEKVIPGNALAVSADKPFTGLSRFGLSFLNKFECSQCMSPILEKITFIDTPGVLSGEKQRLGRAYNFTDVIKWFAERCDRILLLFDAHKLDISDELKDAIGALRGHDDKIRCVLNKADMVSPQQLMRVYGALMWSLGKVVQTPEVLRVYIGSFWDQPLKSTNENKALFEAEANDLLTDLRTLPRNSTVRKVNELVKRSRQLLVHVHIINFLRKQFGFFGKEKTQQKILTNLLDMFKQVQQETKLPMGDFPHVDRFRETLKRFDIKKFPKVDKKMLADMHHALSVDIPQLMKMLPSYDEMDQEGERPPAFNPFAAGESVVPLTWMVDSSSKRGFDKQFFAQPLTSDNKLSGMNAKAVLTASGLDTPTLKQVWALADCDQDGQLDADEFAVAMFLINGLRSRSLSELPASIPPALIPPSKRHLFAMPESY